MTTNPEDQIRAWANASMESTTAEPISAEDITRGSDAASPSRRRSRPVLGAAAALVLIAGVAVGINLMSGGSADVQVGSNGQAGDDPVVTSAPGVTVPTTTSTPLAVPTVGDVRFVVLARNVATLVEMGSLQAAETIDDLNQILFDGGLAEETIDPIFDRYVIVSITIPDDACPPELAGFTKDEEFLEPVFVETVTICNEPLLARKYVVSLDLETTGDSFTLRLPGQPRNEFEDQILTIEMPRLQTDSISFWGIAHLNIGEVLPANESILDEFAPCGFWTGRNGGSGLATQNANGLWQLIDLRTTNFADRTPSNLGVGSTLADLERVYGDRLVIDHPDAERTPTDGLIASYQPVAAVREDDQAITYILGAGDLVQSVKVSSADSWGDDEGCA